LKKIFGFFTFSERFPLFEFSTLKVEGPSFKALERQSLPKGSHLLAWQLKTQLLKPWQRFFSGFENGVDMPVFRPRPRRSPKASVHYL
jgi:hypothetical protein